MKKGLFKLMIFALTLVFCTLLFTTSVNANDISLQTAKLYGQFDFQSTEITSVIVELEEKSIIESKHAGINQSDAYLQIVRDYIIEDISNHIYDINVKREYEYLFSGFSLDLPQNEVLKLLTIDGIKAVYPNVQYETLVTEKTMIETFNPEMMESGPYVGAPDAWSMGYTGEGVRVAVIDTGIDYTHPYISHAFGDYKGYDFVDNDCDPIYGYDRDGYPEYHATHVAGTIAMAYYGIAPNVNLLSYRVLGGPDGTGTSDQVIAGIEQAVIDGADVMNLSLGNSLNDPDYATSIALDWAMAEGVVAVTSNGNNGPDNWTVGSPGASREAISVGASELPHYVYDVVNFFTSEEVSYPSLGIMGDCDLEELLALNGNTYEFVYVGLGYPEDYIGTDVEGKIALISRGDFAFVDKAFIADYFGAAGAIIFNNVDQDFSFSDIMALPTFKLSKADGEKMLDELDLGHNEVTISVEGYSLEETIADFSSRGPAFATWMIKPDVSAPGVDIFSLYPGGYFATASGTSMASPHVAGAAALILQAHPDWSVEEVKAALMNTADTIINPYTGEPYPHNTQGAGSIRIAQAIQTETLVTPGSYSFGKFVKDTGKQVKGLHFEIQNLSNDRKNYTFKVEFEGQPKGIKVMNSKNTKVHAHQSQQVHVNVQVDTRKLTPGYYEGTITVSDGIKEIVVPTILFVQEPDYPRVTDAGVIPYDIPGYYLAYGYLPAGAEYTQIDIYTFNETNGTIEYYLGTPFWAYNVEPGYYIELWDGTINAQPLPPDQYVIVVWADYLGQLDYYATLFVIE